MCDGYCGGRSCVASLRVIKRIEGDKNIKHLSTRLMFNNKKKICCAHFKLEPKEKKELYLAFIITTMRGGRRRRNVCNFFARNKL